MVTLILIGFVWLLLAILPLGLLALLEALLK